MSRSEFEDWRQFYQREPWGVIIDDRRHIETCLLLQSVAGMWSKQKNKINVKQYKVSTTEEVIEELITQLKSNLSCPWKDDRDQKTVALEGQALFDKISKVHGKKK